MTAPELTTEERENELKARLQFMEQQLERLTARLGDEDAAGCKASGSHTEAPRSTAVYPHEDISDVSEEVLNWASRNALMPRLATLCFLLVVALILRTVTDSGMLNKLMGSALGMSYAAILMGVSWHKYSRQSPLAPVFAACGAVLMSVIVVETHVHFQSLPLVPAYVTLAGTGIIMAYISRRFDAVTPITVGTLGMCFAGAAIDYPHPFFPYVSLLLLSANILADVAARMKLNGWLRWPVTFVSMFMLQLWGLRLGAALKNGESVLPELAAAWFLPILAIFSATFFVCAVLEIACRKSEEVARFAVALPTINSLWAFSTAYYVINAGGSGTRLLGIVGTMVAVGLVAASFWLIHRSQEGAPGVGAFTFAGGVLLALALPAATGKLIYSLPIISLVAIFMAVMSRTWKNGSVRLATYLFHIYCSMALVVILKGGTPAALDAVNIIPSGLLALIILYQYQWCRWCPPTPGYAFFDSFDPRDRNATLLLVAGLTSGFFMMRCVIYQTLQTVFSSVPPDAFQCAQSVLINSAAVGLIVLAFVRRSREIRNIAILVTVFGGGKVFIYDLLGAHGMSLVFSVLSFGIAVAAESVALGKWPKNIVEDQVSKDVQVAVS